MQHPILRAVIFTGQAALLVLTAWVGIMLFLSLGAAYGAEPFDSLQQIALMQQRKAQLAEAKRLLPSFRAGVVESTVACKTPWIGYQACWDATLIWPIPVPDGACDDQDSCTAATDEACEDAGHGGVKADTVLIVVGKGGSQSCSGECSGGCNTNGECPTALIDCGE